MEFIRVSKQIKLGLSYTTPKLDKYINLRTLDKTENNEKKLNNADPNVVKEPVKHNMTLRKDTKIVEVTKLKYKMPELDYYTKNKSINELVNRYNKTYDGLDCVQ